MLYTTPYILFIALIYDFYNSDFRINRWSFFTNTLIRINSLYYLSYSSIQSLNPASLLGKLILSLFLLSELDFYFSILSESTIYK